MNFTNLKQVITSVREDVPKLLGFENANILILDTQNSDNLFTINIDEEAEKREKELGNYSVERDFVFNEK